MYELCNHSCATPHRIDLPQSGASATNARLCQQIAPSPPAPYRIERFKSLMPSQKALAAIKTVVHQRSYLGILPHPFASAEAHRAWAGFAPESAKLRNLTGGDCLSEREARSESSRPVHARAPQVARLNFATRSSKGRWQQGRLALVTFIRPAIRGGQ